MLGRLSCLERCTLCGQMMSSVDSARAMLALGRLLPSLEVGGRAGGRAGGLAGWLAQGGCTCGHPTAYKLALYNSWAFDLQICNHDEVDDSGAEDEEDPSDDGDEGTDDDGEACCC